MSSQLALNSFGIRAPRFNILISTHVKYNGRGKEQRRINGLELSNAYQDKLHSIGNENEGPYASARSLGSCGTD